MNIHSLYILKRSGIPCYHREFSDVLAKVDPNLLSSFFTAILDFSRAIIKKEIDVLDIGEQRFFFRSGDEVIFILVTDPSYSILLIRERLNLIHNLFIQRIGNTYKSQDQCIENEAFDREVDAIVNLQDSYNPERMQSIQQVFEDHMANGEIVAGAMLSLTGNVYYSTLPAEFLHMSMRELEIRMRATTSRFKSHDIPKLIFQAGNRLVFSQTFESEKLGDQVNIVLLFDARTNLGMADFALESLIEKLKSSL